MTYKELEKILNKLKDIYGENLEIINISTIESKTEISIRIIFRRDGEGIDDYNTMFYKQADKF